MRIATSTLYLIGGHLRLDNINFLRRYLLNFFGLLSNHVRLVLNNTLIHVRLLDIARNFKRYLPTIQHRVDLLRKANYISNKFRPTLIRT